MNAAHLDAMMSLTHHTNKTTSGRRYWRAATVLPGERTQTFFEVSQEAEGLYSYSARTLGRRNITGWADSRREAVKELVKIITHIYNA